MPDSPVDAAVGWHDAIAERFDAGYSRSPAFMERHRVWSAAISKSLHGGETVLDAGCGSGVFSFMAANKARHVDAIDGSANMVAIAKREQAARGISNIEFSQSMLADLTGYSDASYDLIMSSSVLEYVENYETVLADFARLLRPGGQLLLSMPNADSLYRKAEAVAFSILGRPRYYAHVRNVVTAPQLTHALSAVGMTARETHYFAEPPLPSLINRGLASSRCRKTLFLVEAELAS